MSSPTARRGQVISFITQYKQRVELQHGWEVELQCPECGHESVPTFADGLTPKPNAVAKNVADSPLICATVTCSECGHDLNEQAGVKLIELFKDVPRTTIGWLSVVLGVLLFSPVAVFVIGWAGHFAGWWGDGVGWVIYPAMALCLIVFLAFYYMVQPLIYSCECGKPRFLFMGVLGRSYCFRCSSCSRLLRRGR